MSGGINYLYQRGYNGFENAKGLSLVSKNSAVDSKSSQYYSSLTKDRLASGVTSKIYEYQKHTDQRSISPNTQQISRYPTNNSINSYSQSTAKYQIPFYKQSIYHNNKLSSEKEVLNKPDILNKQQNSNSHNSQQQSTAFDNSQALRSPYIPRYNQQTTSPYHRNGEGRSTSQVNGQTSYTTQRTSNESAHQSITASMNTGVRTNTYNSDNTFSNVYSSLSGNNLGVNTSQNFNQEKEGVQNGEVKSFRPYQYTRSQSTNVQESNLQNDDSYISKNNQVRLDSFSPNKRVTFNLERNTYTDIDQIEQRLNESTRLKPADEDDDIDLSQKNIIELDYKDDDLSKRFDEAINRSEKIISDCLRIGREENSAQSDLTTPTGRRMIRNPSKSKSPIKSSLKRIPSFGSPQKSERITPNAADSVTESNIQIVSGQQKFSDLLDSCIMIQQNKLSKDLPEVEKLIEVRQPDSFILQNSQVYENQSNLNVLTTVNSSTSNTINCDHSYNQRASNFERNSPNQENDSPLNSKGFDKNQNNNSTKLDQPSISELKKSSQLVKIDQIQNQQQKQTDIPVLKQTAQAIKPRKGILRYSDGSRYDGEILNNQRHGFGTLLSSEFQAIYQGNWENDTYNGKGKFFNPTAENIYDEYDYNDFDEALSQYWESYDGEFIEGKLDGFGTLMLTNGEKLVGNFKKGRITGKGTFYCIKGPAVTGIWEDNSLIEKY